MRFFIIFLSANISTFKQFIQVFCFFQQAFLFLILSFEHVTKLIDCSSTLVYSFQFLSILSDHSNVESILLKYNPLTL